MSETKSERNVGIFILLSLVVSIILFYASLMLFADTIVVDGKEKYSIVSKKRVQKIKDNI